MSRSVTVRIRVTETERAELERRAEAAGVGFSEWARKRLLGRAVEEDGRHAGVGQRWPRETP